MHSFWSQGDTQIDLNLCKCEAFKGVLEIITIVWSVMFYSSHIAQ